MGQFLLLALYAIWPPEVLFHEENGTLGSWYLFLSLDHIVTLSDNVTLILDHCPNWPSPHVGAPQWWVFAFSHLSDLQLKTVSWWKRRKTSKLKIKKDGIMRSIFVGQFLSLKNLSSHFHHDNLVYSIYIHFLIQLVWICYKRDIYPFNKKGNLKVKSK
jgi:hypothetical protein